MVSHISKTWNSCHGRATVAVGFLFFFSHFHISQYSNEIEWSNGLAIPMEEYRKKYAVRKTKKFYKFRQIEWIMWRDWFKIYNDRLDRRRHNINTMKWAMQESPHQRFLREQPKYMSNYLGVRWAIFWCSLASKWCPMSHAMHLYQFRKQRTMLRWLYFGSTIVAPWRMISVSTNPNLCRQRYGYCYWICCFSSRVDHRHRSIGTIFMDEDK